MIDPLGLLVVTPHGQFAPAWHAHNQRPSWSTDLPCLVVWIWRHVNQSTADESHMQGSVLIRPDVFERVGIDLQQWAEAARISEMVDVIVNGLYEWTFDHDFHIAKL